MDEDDAAQFHTLRFRSAKKRRDFKVAAAEAARLEAEADAAKAAAVADRQAAGLLPLEDTLQPAPPKGIAPLPPPLPAAEEEEEDDDDEENEEGPEDENEKRGAAATAAAKVAPTSNALTEGGGGGDTDGDSVSSPESELVTKAEVADAKVAQTMEAFLCQLFFQPAEAATYAAVLSQLGCRAPKDLHGVTQATLTHAGIKKFHARKICSAEIYRAFL